MGDDGAFPGGAEAFVRLFFSVEAAPIHLVEENHHPVHIFDLPLHPFRPAFHGSLWRLHVGVHHYGQSLSPQCPDEAGDALLMLDSRVGVTDENLGRAGDHDECYLEPDSIWDAGETDKLFAVPNSRGSYLPNTIQTEHDWVVKLQPLIGSAKAASRIREGPARPLFPLLRPDRTLRLAIHPHP
jgi:hypothetical protein